MWSEGGDMPGRLGAAAGLRSGRGLLDLFPGASAPRPEALPRSTQMGSSVRERNQVTFWTRVLRAQFISMMRLHSKARTPTALGVAPRPRAGRDSSLPPSCAPRVHPADIAAICGQVGLPPQTELLEHGDCFIIYLASQSLRLRYWM